MFKITSDATIIQSFIFRSHCLFTNSNCVSLDPKNTNFARKCSLLVPTTNSNSLMHMLLTDPHYSQTLCPGDFCTPFHSGQSLRCGVLSSVTPLCGLIGLNATRVRTLYAAHVPFSIPHRISWFQKINHDCEKCLKTIIKHPSLHGTLPTNHGLCKVLNHKRHSNFQSYLSERRSSSEIVRNSLNCG